MSYLILALLPNIDKAGFVCYIKYVKLFIDIMNEAKILEKIGLNQSEVNLYLVNLRLGPASAIQLARKINLTRQMVYTLLDKLMESGLIKKVQIENKQYFQAINPDVLIDISEKLTRELHRLVPKLKAEQTQTASIPIISVYENIISMREWYRNYMKQANNGEELLIWSSGKTNDWYNLDREFYNKYLRFSDKNNIKSIILLPDTSEARKYQKQIGSVKREYRFIKNGWDSNAEKWIWRNQICYLTATANSVNMIVVESKDLAELERCGFWNVWENAKV